MEWLWAWRLPIGDALHLRFVSATVQPATIAAEALGGPLLLQLAWTARDLRRRSIGAHLRRQHRREMKRRHALDRDLRRGVRGIHVPAETGGHGLDHPRGAIRLGVDAESNHPFDLDVAELTQHVFVPGASGSGKTTTLARLADGCMAAGWSVVDIDCKGSGLLRSARQLAARYGAPLTVVDPDDRTGTHGYNPCTGDGPAVANKLVGAFNFGADAEIYENISSYVLSVATDAMRSAGRPVTLASLIAALGKDGLSDIAGDLADDDPLRDELISLDTLPASDLTRKGIAGMLARLRALAAGKFGAVFRAAPALDWDRDTAAPGVIFLALPTTGASKDVNLMARVLVQDLKQLCDRRLRAAALGEGEDLTPLLLIIDEFAQLSWWPRRAPSQQWTARE